MQQYLDGLLADLRACHGQFPPRPNMRALAPEPDYPAHRENLMALFYGPRYAMAELFGLEAEAFPPAEQLTAEQVDTLAQAILDLWASVNLKASLPKGLPLRLVYPFLVAAWRDDEVPILHDAKVPLEFCPGHPARCPWPEQYCMCKDD